MMKIIKERNEKFMEIWKEERNKIDIDDKGNIDYMIRKEIEGGVENIEIYREERV